MLLGNARHYGRCYCELPKARLSMLVVATSGMGFVLGRAHMEVMSGFLKTAAYGHFGRDDPAWEVVKPLKAKEDNPRPEMLRCCRYIRSDKDID